MKNIGKHRIQKHILTTLSGVESARFTDLRPPKAETNLLTYHLGILLDNDLISKKDNEYFLTQKGAEIQSVLNRSHGAPSSPPSTMIMFVIQNSNGDLLIEKRTEPPHVNKWSLPAHVFDGASKSLIKTAQQVASSRVKLKGVKPLHAGSAYVRVRNGSKTISTVLAHVFKFNSDEVKVTDKLVWVRPHKLKQHKTTLGLEAIAARTFFNDPFFFEEFDEVWYN